MIQDARSTCPISATIAGRAVATIVWSTTAKNIGSMIDGNIVRNPEDFGAGVAVASFESSAFGKVQISCSARPETLYQCAIITGKLARVGMWRVAPPKII